MKNPLTCLAAVLWSIAAVYGQSVEIRVADIGAGLATVTTLPTGEVIVYDTGLGSNFMPTLRELVPNKVIDLLILSHNDADHIGGVEAISRQYTVKTIFLSEYRDDTCPQGNRKVYCKAMEAVKKMEASGANVTRVTNCAPKPGTVIMQVGDATVTYLCGFDDPDALWTFKSGDRPSKPRNAISLVVRLDYGDHSVLFCGDAVGKLGRSADCRYTEKFLLDSVGALLDADIVIAPHHGADNGSCDGFIKAVTPEYVIFSAGSKHGHPRATTVNRYIANGVKKENFFRTDRGDEERKERDAKAEWAEGRVPGCIDQPFDDDVTVTLSLNQKPLVAYLDPDGCACEFKREDNH